MSRGNSSFWDSLIIDNRDNHIEKQALADYERNRQANNDKPSDGGRERDDDAKNVRSDYKPGTDNTANNNGGNNNGNNGNAGTSGNDNNGSSGAKNDDDLDTTAVDDVNDVSIGDDVSDDTESEDTGKDSEDGGEDDGMSM